MAEEQRTLRKLSAPNMNQQPLCIQHPTLEVGFELRSGLLPMERNMMDAASGGAIVNKTPCQARDLISIMAANSQQFGCRQDASSRRVNELVIGNVQQVKACGICAVTGHPIDMCPTLQYDSCEQANVIGGMFHNNKLHLHNKLHLLIQLASTVGRLESQGKLSSQTIVNPKQNVSAITLRSGKELSEPTQVRKTPNQDEETEKEVHQSQDDQKPIGEHPKTMVIPPPFPSRLAKSKKVEEEKEILETFRKVEVYIPLFDAIKQIPRYAKFLKELCTNKRKLKGNEMVSMGGNVSAILQKKLPPKCKNPGMFAIPCKIGSVNIERAMLDLGASINVMPLSVYSSLNVGPLKETGIIIQLVDRSNVYPKGALEDILVQVQGLVFRADFYVVDMEEDNNSYDSTLILLGRPF
ncbi:PREDICTED: uncharacterized protein LOC109172885 [Ipomoea nil]|uniref:uncharacterized protein LOC109172885 n=1 Tax=Ipomoea nil TaxID=35883 RepID=UPI000900D5A3|nr:PREDICTED: uncharacterized protein LOC109172885 [Ipomoea nil]